VGGNPARGKSQILEGDSWIYGDLDF
jgi:hypothetical protein